MSKIDSHLNLPEIIHAGRFFFEGDYYICMARPPLVRSVTHGTDDDLYRYTEIRFSPAIEGDCKFCGRPYSEH